MTDLSPLCKTLNYKFKNLDYLKQALTHRSKRKNHNERLEFLGDSVLGCVVAETMYETFPHADEGTLSRYKISLVNGKTLSELARELNLSEYIELGLSEIKSGGHLKARLLEDAIEAVFGAIYLDSDYVIAKASIQELFKSRIDLLLNDGVQKDAKSTLQEYCHKYAYDLPLYTLDKTEGEDHNQRIYVTCLVVNLALSAQASSPGRKLSEQMAAEIVLEKLKAKLMNDKLSK